MKNLIAAVSTAGLIAGSALAEEPKGVQVTRVGSQASVAGPTSYFTGTVRIDAPFSSTGGARIGGATVTFEPGARTAWHTHPLGQTLIVTAGAGRVQHWDGPVQVIQAGDTVWIPPGVKHWHGAAPTTAMTHIAIAEAQEGKVVEWLEQVSEAQYKADAASADSKISAAASTVPPATDKPSQAQQLFGDVAPKFAELTDKVLYADVWERPELSKRDRSLVTVSALIALNRPDQLRSHMTLASQNGLTREELVETITHLAFYSGWPNSVTAAAIAKDVFPATP